MNILGRSALMFLCVFQTLQAVSWTYVTQKYKQLHAWHTKTFDLPAYATLETMTDGALRDLIRIQRKHVAVLGAGVVLSGFCIYASCSYIGGNAAADCVKHNIFRRFAGACVKTTSKGLVACSLPAPMVVIALCANSIYDKMCIIAEAQRILTRREAAANAVHEAQQQKKRDQDLQAQQEDMQKKLDAAQKTLHGMDAKLDALGTGQQDMQQAVQAMGKSLQNHIEQQQDFNRRLAQAQCYLAEQLERQGRILGRAQGRRIAGRQQQERIRQRAPRLLR